MIDIADEDRGERYGADVRKRRHDHETAAQQCRVFVRHRLRPTAAQTCTGPAPSGGGSNLGLELTAVEHGHRTSASIKPAPVPLASRAASNSTAGPSNS